jgi:hypothetical protein
LGRAHLQDGFDGGAAHHVDHLVDGELGLDDVPSVVEG